MNDFKIDNIETGCPPNVTGRCKRMMNDDFCCIDCHKEYIISLIRAATSGIVTTATQNRIIKKAGRLLEGE